MTTSSTVQNALYNNLGWHDGRPPPKKCKHHDGCTPQEEGGSETPKPTGYYQN